MVRKTTEIRQEEIKSAVLDIISKEGIRSVSSKKLAEYVGISDGAIFRHFKSKEVIMSSIIDSVSSELIEGLRKITIEDMPPRERLYKFICHTIGYLTDHNGITILLLTEVSHTNDEMMMKKLNFIFNSQRKLIGRIIADGMAEGIWDSNVPIKDVTMFYMGLPITLNINLILSKRRFNKKRFCKNMTGLLERMLQKQE